MYVCLKNPSIKPELYINLTSDLHRKEVTPIPRIVTRGYGRSTK